jgi:hypothetical protein
MTNRAGSIAALAILCFVLRISARQDDAVPFPADYRDWAHVRSTLVGPESSSFKTNGGLHHYYANAKALEGYRTGTFPDGSILIDDLLEMQPGKTQGVTLEGPRRRLAVMVRNEKKYATTGGWGFEVFKADTRVGSLDSDSQAACFECHESAPKNAVFTTLRK